MDIVSPQIEAYLDELLPSEDPVLRDMEREGRERRFPIVGPQVGRLLFQIARLSQAKRIFEMGSGFGYSAYWFLKAMPPDGRVTLTDASPENLDRARKYFEQAGFSQRADLQVGDALEIIESCPGPFDIIFNDIDKEQYPQAFQKAMPRLRRGGVLITDNVLWFGSVLTDSDEPDVRGVREYNRLIAGGRGFFSAVLPIRDGLGLTVKL